MKQEEEVNQMGINHSNVQKIQTKHEIIMRDKKKNNYDKEHLEDDTDYEEPRLQLSLINDQVGPELQTIYIDQQLLPYIFRYKYPALKKLAIKKSSSTPRIAYEIFDYITKKVVVRRTFYSSKYESRMKYQEKIKFLMRAFIYRRCIAVPGKYQKITNFNKQNQVQFFKREDVKEHFMQQIDHAILVKEVQNERLIKHFQECITFALKFSDEEYHKAKLVVDNRVKRRQLPWTQNMFKDIKQFSRQLYKRYTNPEQIGQQQRDDSQRDKKSPQSKQNEIFYIKKQNQWIQNGQKYMVKLQTK